MKNDTRVERTVIVSDEKLEGDLAVPAGAQAIVLFSHGSGSSRHSTRNQYVAKTLNDAGFATLLVDLLTKQEKEIDEKNRHLRFDIDLLARRLLVVTKWLLREPEINNLKIGYFGSSTGAAAALIAAAKLDNVVKTIICRGGRPDLAESRGVLQHVTAPTLMIVGGNDIPVIALNKAALKQLLHAETKELVIIPNAGHLFEESGKMDEVAQLAANWFECYLLMSGKKFKNKYRQKTSRLFPLFNKSHIHIRFKNRAAAGDMLASLLSKYNKDRSITVIGIARGGVLVADVIARKLNANFDIVVPRKLRAPDNSENAIGAIMQDGLIYLDNLTGSKVSNEYLEMEKSEQKKEIVRRMSLYRPQPKRYDIKGKTVILVDDGAATGATIIVAARWIKKQEPQLLIIGVPVAPQNTVDLLLPEADHVELIHRPSISMFYAIEHFYEDFDPVADCKVIQIVKERIARAKDLK